MNWARILEIGAAIVVAFGGAGVIISAFVKFSVKQIAESLQKKYDLKLSKELEAFKNTLGNKSYISKTRFDAEFAIYRKISGLTVSMVKDVSQLFPVFTRDGRSDLDVYKEKYNTAYKSVMAFQDELASSAPFISEEIYPLFCALEEKCKRQVSDFIDFRLRPDASEFVKECRDEYNKVWDRTRQIQADSDEIIKALRSYLSQLDVV